MRLMVILGFQEGSMPFRYLGILLASKKLRITNYSPLMDSLIRKINSWPKKTLSYAGQWLISWFSLGRKGVKTAYDHFRGVRARKPWASTMWKGYL